MPTPIKNMPMMGVRKFRDEFPKLTEPVRVIRATGRDGEGPKVLGVWTPQKQQAEQAK